MLYGLLVFFYVLLCIFMVLLILVQKGKSSLGIGTMGGGSQMLFGASGGQDIFQKTTWVMGFLLMSGSLILSLMKSSQAYTSQYISPVSKSAYQASTAPVEQPQEVNAEQSTATAEDKPAA
jgi:preprotein translocase subunit SecG